MGTEHRTIMRSTEKENFLDHIKNLAFGRGQPLPLALWDPKTKRFTISIMIQQLKICHASLVQLDLLPAQCNYKDSWQSHLGILNFAFCILCVYPILYIAYRLYCSAFISCSGDFKPRMNQSHVTTFESLREFGLWQHSFQVKDRCRVPKKILSVCGIEKVLRGSEQDSFQEKVGYSNIEFTLGNKTVDWRLCVCELWLL